MFYVLLQHSAVEVEDIKEINSKLGFENTNLEISPSQLQPNETKRKLFKSFMNSCIGKFAQRKNFPNSKFVRSAEDIDQVLKNGEEITDFSIIDEYLCRLETTPKTEHNIIDRKTNPIITAFVTALSRIDMHCHIIKLSRVGFTPLYTDTDSLIFFGPKNQKVPLPTRPFFGNFKEEFKKAELDAFCCVGKKNYAVTMKEKGKEKTELKVRGLSFQSQTTLSNISFMDFKNFLCIRNNFRSVPQARLKTNKNSYEVSKHIVPIKIATTLNFHRILLPNNTYKTLPYGYKS